MTATDPVCKKELRDEEILARSTYLEETYYFCSEACKTHFDEDPLRFLMLRNVFVPPDEITPGE